MPRFSTTITEFYGILPVTFFPYLKCGKILSASADDAGIVINPFARIPKPTMDKEPRQPGIATIIGLYRQ